MDPVGAADPHGVLVLQAEVALASHVASRCYESIERARVERSQVRAVVWKTATRLIKLKPREYALIEYLALRRGEVVSRRDIETHIYADEADPMSNVVDSAVSVLRKRITLPGSAPLIHTRHGLGYILKAESE